MNAGRQKKPMLMKILIGFSLWLLVSLLVSVAVISSQYLEQQSRFERLVDLAKKQVEARDQRIKVLLQATASMYQSGLSDDDYSFSVFAHSVQEHLPYVKLLGIAKNENQQDVKMLKHSMYEDGYESFRVFCGRWFQDEQCPTTWSDASFTNQAFVMPIVQLEPFIPENSVFLGQNLVSLPGVKTTLMQSIEKNHSQLLLLNVLAHKHLDDSQLMLVYQPFYQPTLEPLTSAQRPKNMRGVVLILLSVKTTIASIESLFDEFGDIHANIAILSHGQTVSPPVEQSWFSLHGEFIVNDFNSRICYELVKPFGWQDINHWTLLSFLLLGWWLLAIVSGMYYQLREHSQQLETQKLRMAKVFETSHDAVVVLNEKGQMLDWNPEAENFFGGGLRGKGLESRTILEFLKPSPVEGVDKQAPSSILTWLDIQLKDGDKAHKQVSVHNQHEQHLILDIACSVIATPSGYEISLFMRDQTEQHQAQERVKHLAYYDTLTHLKNRVSFEQVMHEMMDMQTPFSIFFFDLDGFKQINDDLGHNIGDELLKVLGRRLIHWKKEHPSVSALSRFGGDEFVILLEETDTQALRQLANGLLAMIVDRIHIYHHDLHISASLGVARYPEDGESIGTLLKRADIAMYEAKSLGSNSYSFYEARFEEVLTRDIQIQRNLRLALKRKELYLVYQPKINLNNGETEAVEALLRWQSAELGNVTPDEFIPIAEKTHMIGPIGDWVIKEVLRQLVLWRTTLPQIKHVAINLSSVQLQQQRFVTKLVRLVNKAGLAPDVIELELTERIVMSNTQVHMDKMHEMREANFSLSVDDFGTGYSSLSYLKDLPLDVLKIDKSFIHGLPYNKDDVAIVTAIVEMAHSLGLRVVAEGVEESAQLQFMQALGCDYVQGYLTGKPMTAEQLERTLKH